MNPLTAKWRFKFRHFNNWLWALGLFASLAYIFNAFLPGLWVWGADALAIVVISFLFFKVWYYRAILIECDLCHKKIGTNIPWICGFKQCRNDNVDEYPFVHRCEHCGAEPKAYMCHHCDTEHLIFLTPDQFKNNYARCTRPSRVRDDLDIADLEKNRRKAVLEVDIAQYDKTLGRFTKPDPYEEDKRRRANEEADMDHQMLMIKRRATNAQAEANARALEEANLPERERAQRKYKRREERFEIADEGRALVEKRWPKDSIGYRRGMAIWTQYEEDGSISM
jgi:hypothetical protein